MKLQLDSLKKKVAFGYVVGFVIVFAVASINWSMHGRVKETVLSCQRVSGLFDMSIEIRRLEKSYLMYGKDEDMRELGGLVDNAGGIVSEDPGMLLLFTTPEVLAELRKSLEKYKKLLYSVRKMQGYSSKSLWEDRLKEEGKNISETIEDVSRTGGKASEAVLKEARDTVIASLVLVAFTGFLTGALFYRMFIKPFRSLEDRMNRIADGEFSLSPIESSDREFVSLNRAFERMLSELEARRMRLIESEKLASLGRLLSGAAQELHDPLSNISTSCRILVKNASTADAKFKQETLSQIEDETERAKEMLRSLLDFSIMGKKETFDIAKAVEDAKLFVKTEMAPKTDFLINIPEGLSIFADRQKLVNAFTNLFKNSAEATAEKVKISVSSRILDDGSVEITVSDNGPGIKPSVLPKIFNPFFSTKGYKKGAGLGLFTVHNIIVNEHGGSIDASSEEGGGATFKITLPQSMTAAL